MHCSGSDSSSLLYSSFFFFFLSTKDTANMLALHFMNLDPLSSLHTALMGHSVSKLTAALKLSKILK